MKALTLCIGISSLISGCAPSEPPVALDLGTRASLLYSCGEGSTLDCERLGEDYHEGRTGEVDASLALVFYGKACEGGVPEGCLNGASVVRESEQPPAVQITWLLRGCGMEDSQVAALCCFRAAQAYADLDEIHAVESYLSRACSGGHAEACSWAAAFYSEGGVFDLNPQRASQLRARACDLGDQPSCEGGAR